MPKLKKRYEILTIEVLATPDDEPELTKDSARAYADNLLEMNGELGGYGGDWYFQDIERIIHGFAVTYEK